MERHLGDGDHDLVWIDGWLRWPVYHFFHNGWMTEMTCCRRNNNKAFYVWSFYSPLM